MCCVYGFSGREEKEGSGVRREGKERREEKGGRAVETMLVELRQQKWLMV